MKIERMTNHSGFKYKLGDRVGVYYNFYRDGLKQRQRVLFEGIIEETERVTFKDSTTVVYDVAVMDGSLQYIRRVPESDIMSWDEYQFLKAVSEV